MKKLGVFMNFCESLNVSVGLEGGLNGLKEMGRVFALNLFCFSGF